METGLTTDPISHAIITGGGAHHLITQKVNQILEMANLDDLIETQNGTKIKVASIMEIMPITEYYNIYPQKKPAPEHDGFKKYEPILMASTKATSRNGLASMIKGLQRAVDEFRAEGKEPLNALKLLDKAKKEYEVKYGKNGWVSKPTTPR